MLAAGLADLLFQFAVFSLEGSEALYRRFPHTRQCLCLGTEKRSHFCLHILHLREEKDHHHDTLVYIKILDSTLVLNHVVAAIQEGL